MGTPGPIELIIVIVLVGLLPAWFFWRICAKAGYPGPLGLLIIIPVANLILLGVLAFDTWPIHQTMKDAGMSAPSD